MIMVNLLISTVVGASMAFTTLQPGNMPNNRLGEKDMPISASTSEWMVDAMKMLNDGDRIDGSLIRLFVDPEDFSDGETEIAALIDAVDFLEVDKKNDSDVELRLYLKGAKDMKKTFVSDGKKVKIELRHKRTRLKFKKVLSKRVQMRISGIGAAYGGAPIPERLVLLTLERNDIKEVKLAGIKVDAGQSVDLPSQFLAEE